MITRSLPSSEAMASTASQSRPALKRWARWLATFIGFPAAGVTARLVAGDIDTATAAVLGGLARRRGARHRAGVGRRDRSRLAGSAGSSPLPRL